MAGQLEELLIRRTFNWEFEDPPNHCGGLRQCRFRDTEFQFSVIPFLDLALMRPKNLRLHDRYIATVKTKWANFGNGSPAWSEKYKRQFMDEWQEPLTGFPEPVHNHIVFEPGSIKDAFEGNKEFDFESVVSKEKKRAIKALLINNDQKLVKSGHPKFRTPF
jgi:hypothetical protein